LRAVVLANIPDFVHNSDNDDEDETYYHFNFNTKTFRGTLISEDHGLAVENKSMQS
jgi:hypothetical protein